MSSKFSIRIIPWEKINHYLMMSVLPNLSLSRYPPRVEGHAPFNLHLGRLSPQAPLFYTPWVHTLQTSCRGKSIENHYSYTITKITRFSYKEPRNKEPTYQVRRHWGAGGQCPPIIRQTCFWRCYKRSLIWQQFWQQFILAIHAPPHSSSAVYGPAYM